MDQKNVQTTLPEATYEGLVRIAKERNRSIKAVVREAIEAYVAAEAGPARDSLDDFIGSGTLPPGNWSQRKDWRTW